jgi:hypothetical protein
MATEKITFLSLPAELRNEIYMLALFGGNDASKLTTINTDHFLCFYARIRYATTPYGRHILATSRYGYIQKALRQPSLSRASRQIRAEVLPMVYHVLRLKCRSSGTTNWDVILDYWGKVVGMGNIQFTRGLIVQRTEWD